MSFGTIGQLRNLLKLDTKTDVTKFDRVLKRNQADVFAALCARMEQCRPGSTPAPFEVLAKAAAAVADYATQMATGKRRIIVQLAASGFSGGEGVTVKGKVRGLEVEEFIPTSEAGIHMGNELYDELLTADTFTPNAALLALTTPFVAYYENAPGELTDIELRWAGAIFEDERADRYDRESEPPEIHPWLEDAQARFERFLERHCIQKQPGRKPTRTLGRSYP